MKPDEAKPPTVFVSYSHDSEELKSWVLQLATRLRSNGVDVLLDRWNLSLGSDVASFMERGLSTSKRVLCICTDTYLSKANNGVGGAGYEKLIITGKMMSNLNSNWVIPVIYSVSGDEKTPTFLSSRVYTSFEDESRYENSYEDLLRELLDEPVLPLPPLGINPFENLKAYSNQKFIPSTEKYVSPSSAGEVTFDYSNNNGRYWVGQGKLAFEIRFSKASDKSVYVLNDPSSIRSIAIVKDREQISEIMDARVYDYSSRIRTSKLNQIVILQNSNGFYAAIKILTIKDDSRGSEFDEVKFEYTIQTNGTPHFAKKE